MLWKLEAFVALTTGVRGKQEASCRASGRKQAPGVENPPKQHFSCTRAPGSRAPLSKWV